MDTMKTTRRSEELTFRLTPTTVTLQAVQWDSPPRSQATSSAISVLLQGGSADQRWYLHDKPSGFRVRFVPLVSGVALCLCVLWSF